MLTPARLFQHAKTLCHSMDYRFSLIGDSDEIMLSCPIFHIPRPTFHLTNHGP